MNLSEAQRKVLLILDDRPAGPGYIGNMIWGNGYRKPQAYARTAGKVLNALREKSLAIWYPGERGANSGWGWVLTDAGTRMAKSLRRN